tara:strand:- start:83 stop:532 length:450 start_codon:yes stop_codon:yes gene_type:complete
MLNKKWFGCGSTPVDIEKKIDHFLKKGYSIFVGTDSKVYSDCTKFVTIVGLRNTQTKNGVVVYRTTEKITKFLSLHDRLFSEVMKSINTAQEIKEKYEVTCSIHIDVNPDENYKSNKFYDELTGLVKGCDFPVAAKHNSWAADIADMYT